MGIANVSMANYQFCLSARGFDLLIPLPECRISLFFAILCVHLIVTLARLARPGGLRSVVAESVLVRHQLVIVSCGRKRAPHLRAKDRTFAGLCTLFMRPTRILRSAIGLRPSTLLHLHNVLKKRKYRMLFSRPCGRRPGPKGPKQELIHAVVGMCRKLPAGASLFYSKAFVYRHLGQAYKTPESVMTPSFQCK